jgi:DUF177 domain-containing protein
MRLELENLGKDASFAHSYAPVELRLEEQDLRLVEPARVAGHVRRKGEEVQVSGTLTTTVETPCARCLKPVLIPIKAEFFERFVTAVSWRTEELHELASEDLNLAVFDGKTIELDELVREEIELATPVQVFCREDCKGLCPVCGIDRNLKACECGTQDIDSRWEKLKDLRF